MSDGQKTFRLFFALWPNDGVRSSMRDSLSRIPHPNGRKISNGNLHVTLHFVGQVTESTKDCMHKAAKSLNAESFQLNLDRFGYFSRAKIFWMGSQDTPVQLTRLHKELGSAIAECGFNVESRSYTPHVTLMRKCRQVETDQVEFSIPWRVDEFVLVESITNQEGVNYQVIEKYPLT